MTLREYLVTPAPPSLATLPLRTLAASPEEAVRLATLRWPGQSFRVTGNVRVNPDRVVSILAARERVLHAALRFGGAGAATWDECARTLFRESERLFAIEQGRGAL